LRCAGESWEGSKEAGWDSHLHSVEDVFGGGGGQLIHAGLTGRWAATLEEMGGGGSLCLGPQASGMHVSTWMEEEKDTHPWMGRQRERERERGIGVWDQMLRESEGMGHGVMQAAVGGKTCEGVAKRARERERWYTGMKYVCDSSFVLPFFLFYPFFYPFRNRNGHRHSYPLSRTHTHANTATHTHTHSQTHTHRINTHTCIQIHLTILAVSPTLPDSPPPYTGGDGKQEKDRLAFLDLLAANAHAEQRRIEISRL